VRGRTEKQGLRLLRDVKMWRGVKGRCWLRLLFACVRLPRLTWKWFRQRTRTRGVDVKLTHLTHQFDTVIQIRCQHRKYDVDKLTLPSHTCPKISPQINSTPSPHFSQFESFAKNLFTACFTTDRFVDSSIRNGCESLMPALPTSMTMS